MFNSNNFVRSAAFVEVCGLLNSSFRTVLDFLLSSRLVGLLFENLLSKFHFGIRHSKVRLFIITASYESFLLQQQQRHWTILGIHVNRS